MSYGVRGSRRDKGQKKNENFDYVKHFLAAIAIDDTVFWTEPRTTRITLYGGYFEVSIKLLPHPKITPSKQVSISLVPKCVESSTSLRQNEYSLAMTSNSRLVQSNVTITTRKPRSLRQRAVTGTFSSVMPKVVAQKDTDSASSENSLQMNTDKQRISSLVKKAREGITDRKLRDDTSRSTASSKTSARITALAAKESSAQSIKEDDSKTNVIVQRIREFAWTCEQSTVEQLRNEYNALPQPDLRDCKACMAPENIKKNRYSNIPCLDSSRILLNILRPDAGYGYIHANLVEYPSLRNKYIITQGPLPNTINAFWEMIWQENVYYIVMLCEATEKGKRKCAEYFSNTTELPVIYGQFDVILKEQKWEGSFVTSTLELEYEQESRTITHLHWRGWNDFEAPCYETIVALLQKVRGKSTVVVHCSAGIGRSGTFVALEMCLQDLANGLTINVYQAVVSLRQYRALAVQTFEQYLSIHKAILEMGEKHGAISKQDVQRFHSMYCELFDK